jgi:hypothetical protein
VLLSVHHLVQVRGWAFYIEMLVLSRPAFRGEHRATVNSFEVAIRNLYLFLQFHLRSRTQLTFPALKLAEGALCPKSK